MEYFAKGMVFRQWALTLLLGSIIYVVIVGHGLQEEKQFSDEIISLHTLPFYGVCFMLALFWSLMAGLAALILNQLIALFLLFVKSGISRILLLLIPPIITTMVYCVIFPLLAPAIGIRSVRPYLSFAWQTADFLSPWTLSALVIAAAINYRAQKNEKVNSQMNNLT